MTIIANAAAALVAAAGGEEAVVSSVALASISHLSLGSHQQQQQQQQQQQHEYNDNSLSLYQSAEPPNSTNNGTTDCRIICPTLEEFPDAWPIWILVLLYSAIFVASFVLVARNGGGFSFRVSCVYSYISAVLLLVYVCRMCAVSVVWV